MGLLRNYWIMRSQTSSRGGSMVGFMTWWHCWDVVETCGGGTRLEDVVPGGMPSGLACPFLLPIFSLPLTHQRLWAQHLCSTVCFLTPWISTEAPREGSTWPWIETSEALRQDKPSLLLSYFLRYWSQQWRAHQVLSCYMESVGGPSTLMSAF